MLPAGTTVATTKNSEINIVAVQDINIITIPLIKKTKHFSI